MDKEHKMIVEHGWPMGVMIIVSGVMISRDFPPPWVLFAEADTLTGLLNAVTAVIIQLGFYLWGFGYFVGEYKSDIGEYMKGVGAFSIICLLLLGFIIVIIGTIVNVCKAIYSFIIPYL